MSGGRPDGETARRGGLVPYTGSSNGRSNNNNNNVNNNNGSGLYPKVSSNKAGNWNAAPEDVKASNNRGNDQLWSNGSGVQGSAPVWPEDQQQGGAPRGSGTPVNLSNNRQTSAAPGPGGAAGYIQGSQHGPNGAGPQQQYQQQNGQLQQNGPGPQQQQQQQQQPNWQGVPVNSGSKGQNNVPVNSGSKGQNNVPVNSGSKGQNNVPQGAQPQGGFIAQGPQKGPVPKGDYVYYDGNGNQIQPGTAGAPPQGANGSGHWTGSGSERHFHHHYYYNQQQPQQRSQQPPVGYPYDKKMEQKKKRKPGATALAAALIACWACTCCCHAPCGW